MNRDDEVVKMYIRKTQATKSSLAQLELAQQLFALTWNWRLILLIIHGTRLIRKYGDERQERK